MNTMNTLKYKETTDGEWKQISENECLNANADGSALLVPLQSIGQTYPTRGEVKYICRKMLQESRDEAVRFILEELKIKIQQQHKPRKKKRSKKRTTRNRKKK